MIVTLKKELFLSITFILLILLSGSLWVNLKNAQHHLKEQIELHAQETATSLAFSLSNAARNGQDALMNSMVDVIFDSGYYQSIVYRNNQGEPVIERQRPVNVEDVPEWFVTSLPIPTAQGSAMMVSGWQQLGELEVHTHPGLAYRDLWRVFLEQGVLFGIVTALAYLLAALALKVILKPLQEVEEQAKAICQQEFVEQQKLPRTRELRQVVSAMNRMVRKLREIFHEQVSLIENLRRQTFIDPVTQLSNRRDFDARLQAVVDRSDSHSGVLLVIQVKDFAEFNHQHGRQKGDECLRALAEKLSLQFSECVEAIIGRRSGADFAVYLPSFPLERSKMLVERYLKWANQLNLFDQDDCQLGGLHIGISFTKQLNSEHSLFNEADMALRQAQSQGGNAWQVYQEEDIVSAAKEAQLWFAALQRVLKKQDVTLHYQPVFNSSQQPIASEILCRIKDQGKLVKAGIFFPMVERFHLSEQFDRMVLEKIASVHDIPQHRDKSYLSVNLSPQTLTEEGFSDWLEHFLQQHPHLAQRLVLETAAHAVGSGEKELRDLCRMAKQYGTVFSLDHFGIHSGAFSYLHSLPIRYLKVDRAFIKEIHKNSDNQFFVKSLVQIAHSQDILIYAEGVENIEEWQCILELGLDGAQGYFLGKPV